MRARQRRWRHCRSGCRAERCSCRARRCARCPARRAASSASPTSSALSCPRARRLLTLCAKLLLSEATTGHVNGVPLQMIFTPAAHVYMWIHGHMQRWETALLLRHTVLLWLTWDTPTHMAVKKTIHMRLSVHSHTQHTRGEGRTTVRAKIARTPQSGAAEAVPGACRPVMRRPAALKT